MIGLETKRTAGAEAEYYALRGEGKMNQKMEKLLKNDDIGVFILGVNNSATGTCQINTRKIKR